METEDENVSAQLIENVVQDVSARAKRTATTVGPPRKPGTPPPLPTKSRRAGPTPSPQAARGERDRSLARGVDEERALLGTLLLDNSTFRAARDASLGPLHFSTEPHRFTYEAIVELQERGVPVDEITLTEALRRKGQLERVGGSEFLRALSDTIPSMGRAQELARSVRSASTLRSTLRTLRHFIQKAHEGHGGEAAEFLRRASNALSQLGDPDSPPMATLRDKEPQRSAPLSKPYSEEAERAVLASIVLNAKSSPGVMDTLSKDDFYVESHALAFESLRSLRERGATPDTAGLREELQTRGALKLVGGDEFLLGLTDKIPPTANLETHARIVRDLAQVRRAIDLLQTAEQRVLWDRDLEASSFLQQTAAALRDMAHERSPQATREVAREANSSVGQPQAQSQPATAHPEVVAAFGHVPTIAEIAAVGRASPSPALDDREVLSMLEAAEGRLRVLEEESARQRNQGLAEHKANGAPPLPQDPTRKEWLQEQVAARENRTAVPPRFRQNLVRLDRQAAQIRQHVIDNPIWIAADYLVRHPQLLTLDAETKSDSRLREANQRLGRAKRNVRAAKAQLEAFQARAKWVRAALNIFGDTEAKLHAHMRKASQQALVVDRQVQEQLEAIRTEIETRVERHNERAINEQTKAGERRRSLEQPLREALLERHLTEQRLEGGPKQEHLRNVHESAVLRYDGMRHIAGFEFAAFVTAEGATLLVDAADVEREVQDKQLSVGDEVEYWRNAQGVRELAVRARGDAWSLTREISGVVTDVQHREGNVHAVLLRDGSTGEEKWLRPERSDDLLQELQASSRELRPGDSIALQSGKLFVVQRCPELARA